MKADETPKKRTQNSQLIIFNYEGEIKIQDKEKLAERFIFENYSNIY